MPESGGKIIIVKRGLDPTKRGLVSRFMSSRAAEVLGTAYRLNQSATIPASLASSVVRLEQPSMLAEQRSMPQKQLSMPSEQLGLQTLQQKLQQANDDLKFMLLFFNAKGQNLGELTEVENERMKQILERVKSARV